MRKGRILSWVGRHLDTSCDTQFLFLVEDEDFSILLAALESRFVAVIRSWACWGLSSCSPGFVWHLCRVFLSSGCWVGQPEGGSGSDSPFGSLT